MSRQVLRMKYHPAKKEVCFQRFQNDKEIRIRPDSKLVSYMNKRGNFVLQDHGNRFFDDIAAAFDGEQSVHIDVVTTKNDYEDFEQMVDFYNADKPQAKIDSTLLAELPDMDKIFSAVKKHGEHSRDILKTNQAKFFEVNTNNTAVVKECVENFAAEVQKEIDNINEKIEAIADSNVNLCFAGVFSSGKSAIINAIIGYKILPEAIKSETARMFRIQSPKPDEDVVRIGFQILDVYTNLVWNNEEFVFYAGPVESAAREAIQDTINNNKDKPQHDQIYEILKTLNTNDDISSWIHVYFPIPLDNNKVQFTIYDTPGTDSNYGEHQDVLQNALSKQTHSILIFVAGPNRLEGEGNNALLNYLKEAEKKDSKTSIDIGRSLFVINWADSIDIDDRKVLQTEVIKNKEDSDFSIKLSDKKLFFTSAKQAYAAVAVKNNIATKKENIIIEDDYIKIQREESGQYFLQNRCATSELATKNLLDKSNKALDAARKQDDKTEVFHICSGLFSLEEEIKIYGGKFAPAVKAYAIINSVDKALSNMNDYAKSLKAQNIRDIDNINKEIEGLRSTIADGIKDAYNKLSISDNESLPKDILKRLNLTATGIALTIVGEPKAYIEKLFQSFVGKIIEWMPGRLGEKLKDSALNAPRFREDHKNSISQKINAVLGDFTKNFLEERQKLLESQRDEFIETIKDIIRNNGNISEEAKEFIFKIRPPKVEMPDNPIELGEIYDNHKRTKKLLWIEFKTIDKSKFIEAVEDQLRDLAEKMAEDFKSDYRGSLMSLLRGVESEFTQNIDKYSVLMKAKIEDKKAIEQLGDKILSAAEELKDCQNDLERIIWNEKNNEQ